MLPGGPEPGNSDYESHASAVCWVPMIRELLATKVINSLLISNYPASGTKT